jgi:hypothetical protein
MELTEEEKKKFFEDNKENAIDLNSLSNTMKYYLGTPSVSPSSKINTKEIQFYNLDTKFTFGMYKGKSVREVIEMNPTYLDWCAINIIPFYMTDVAIEEIINIDSELLSHNSREILHDKFFLWKEK